MRHLVLFLACALISSCTKEPPFDILILNGTVVDGTGFESVRVDIAIKESEIVKIGNFKSESAKRIIDASGLTISPGFIDLHAHLDPILKHSNGESMLRQGVTTCLGGPDGGGPWPFGKFLDTLGHVGTGINVAYLIGHNTVRKNVLNLENRAPSDSELETMKSQIGQAMDEGAFGISTGLKYLPGSFSEVEEVISLSKIASEKGGIYTSHLREEGLGLLDAVDEAITISEKANIPVVLTHHKVVGKPMWGKSEVTLTKVDSARAQGLNILIDQYPYNASYAGIKILIPAWAQAGGNEAFKQRLTDPKLRDSIKAGIIFNIINDRGGGDLDRVQFAKVSWNPSLEGKTLKYWCEQKGLEPTTENGAELVIEAQTNGGASCVFFAMHEKDVENIMKHPQTMIASDGRLVAPGEGHPHPRWYGTFPRVLGHFVRDKNVLSLEDAIYKMTSFPAQTLGLNDRGKLQVGMKADITIFNAETIADKATFEHPHQYPEGIHYVLINGQLAIDDTNFMDIKAGKVLRKGID